MHLEAVKSFCLQKMLNVSKSLQHVRGQLTHTFTHFIVCWISVPHLIVQKDYFLIKFVQQSKSHFQQNDWFYVLCGEFGKYTASKIN